MAVNAAQAEAWNGTSGRHFLEQRERHERMRGRLTTRLLAASAGVANIRFEVADEPMLVARDVDDVLEYERVSPSAAALLAGLSAPRAAELTRRVRDDLAAYAAPGGVVMPAALWLVTAQAV